MQKRGGGQGGCEPRIEFIVKFKKKSREGGRRVGGGWVIVVVNQELKYL